MFNRPYIKDLAKQRMRGRIGEAIAVSLLAVMLGGQLFPSYTHQFNRNDEVIGQAIIAFLPILLFLGAAGIAFTILVGNVVKIGARGWFLRYWRGENPPIGDLFIGFKRYSPFVVTGLLRNLYVFLWSLLFIIPGIVMHYAYSMADYILYENPNIPASQVLEMSKRMTHGHKADLFVFDLSYLGWALVTAVTCGIVGVVYVNPYIYTAHAGVYETLKADALNRGALRPEEFGMAPPPPPPAGFGGNPQY